MTVSGVLGNTAANGTFSINVVDANSFQLLGTTGNGNYISGGNWVATNPALIRPNFMLGSVMSTN